MNKRVKNARKVVYDGIAFRSSLEVYTYKELLSAGFIFNYEVDKFDLIEEFELENVVAIYPIESGKEKGTLKIHEKINKKTYKPDFTIFNINNHYVVIECKGHPNDDYPTKRKLFLRLLNNLEPENKKIFLEPRNRKHVDWCIEFLNNLRNEFGIKDYGDSKEIV